jgi:predicted phosphate transport protein (TIGR00153 family)
VGPRLAIRLTPQDQAFYELLAAGGENLAAAAAVLCGLLQPDADRQAIADQMRDLEHAGDAVTHQILRQLNTSFVTPFDREDIYALAGRVDDVMDCLDEVAEFILLADIGALPSLIEDQIRLIQRGCTETAGALGRLRTLQDLEAYWIEVNRLENEADDVHRKLVSRMFSGEYEILTMLKLRELADLLEDTSDALEHVAHSVETIAVKES